MTAAPFPRELDGKVAIVTGGTEGIGAAIARELGSAGARVVVASRRPEATAAMAQSLREMGATALGVPLDVLDADSVAALVARVAEELGGIDILVNNAGASHTDRFRRGALLDLAGEDLLEAFRLNTVGAFQCSKAAVPHLRSRAGSIVNIASYVAFQVEGGMGAYGASKASLVHLTRTMAAEWAPEIRVNAVAPGHIDTPRVSANRTPARQAKVLADVALERLGTPEDVAQAVRHVVGPAAAWMTGAVLNIDGGQRLL
jgi:NAD(P)-dependent dehydrogenase (short-subunit alcohol dehydrogenase family)